MRKIVSTVVASAAMLAFATGIAAAGEGGCGFGNHVVSTPIVDQSVADSSTVTTTVKTEKGS